MKIQTHKVISAAFLGLLLGLQVHHSSVKWSHLGRAAYIADQNQYFDQTIASPSPTALYIFVGVAMALIAVGTYELIALGLAKLMSNRPDTHTIQGTDSIPRA